MVLSFPILRLVDLQVNQAWRHPELCLFQVAIFDQSSIICWCYLLRCRWWLSALPSPNVHSRHRYRQLQFFSEGQVIRRSRQTTLFLLGDIVAAMSSVNLRDARYLQYLLGIFAFVATMSQLSYSLTASATFLPWSCWAAESSRLCHRYF